VFEGLRANRRIRSIGFFNGVYRKEFHSGTASESEAVSQRPEGTSSGGENKY
jgi:hypothetical protein